MKLDIIKNDKRKQTGKWYVATLKTFTNLGQK